MSSNSCTSTLQRCCKASSSSSLNSADTCGWFTNFESRQGRYSLLSVCYRISLNFNCINSPKTTPLHVSLIFLVGLTKSKCLSLHNNERLTDRQPLSGLNCLVTSNRLMEGLDQKGYRCDPEVWYF